MSVMDYLKIVVSLATIAPTIVRDVKAFVKAFEDDDTILEVVRTALDAVKTAINDIEAVLPSDNSNTEN